MKLRGKSLPGHHGTQWMYSSTVILILGLDAYPKTELGLVCSFIAHVIAGALSGMRVIGAGDVIVKTRLLPQLGDEVRSN